MKDLKQKLITNFPRLGLLSIGLAVAVIASGVIFQTARESNKQNVTPSYASSARTYSPVSNTDFGEVICNMTGWDYSPPDGGVTNESCTSTFKTITSNNNSRSIGMYFRNNYFPDNGNVAIEIRYRFDPGQYLGVAYGTDPIAVSTINATGRRYCYNNGWGVDDGDNSGSYADCINTTPATGDVVQAHATSTSDFQRYIKMAGANWSDNNVNNMGNWLTARFEYDSAAFAWDMYIYDNSPARPTTGGQQPSPYLGVPTASAEGRPGSKPVGIRIGHPIEFLTAGGQWRTIDLDYIRVWSWNPLAGSCNSHGLLGRGEPYQLYPNESYNGTISTIDLQVTGAKFYYINSADAGNCSAAKTKYADSAVSMVIDGVRYITSGNASPIGSTGSRIFYADLYRSDGTLVCSGFPTACTGVTQCSPNSCNDPVAVVAIPTPIPPPTSTPVVPPGNSMTVRVVDTNGNPKNVSRICFGGTQPGYNFSQPVPFTGDSDGCVTNTSQLNASGFGLACAGCTDWHYGVETLDIANGEQILSTVVGADFVITSVPVSSPYPSIALVNKDVALGSTGNQWAYYWRDFWTNGNRSVTFVVGVPTTPTPTLTPSPTVLPSNTPTPTPTPTPTSTPVPSVIPTPTTGPWIMTNGGNTVGGNRIFTIPAGNIPTSSPSGLQIAEQGLPKSLSQYAALFKSTNGATPGIASRFGWNKNNYLDANTRPKQAPSQTWFAFLDSKLSANSNTIGATVSGSTSALGGNAVDGVYIYKTTNLTVNAGFLCNSKSIFIVTSNLTINPHISTSGFENGCLFVVGGNTIINGGAARTGPEGRYDLVEAYIITNAAQISANGTRGLIIKGGLVTSANNGAIQDTFARGLTAAENANYPSTILRYDARYMYIYGDLLKYIPSGDDGVSIRERQFLFLVKEQVDAENFRTVKDLDEK